jgi:hypothetical protein
MVVPLLHEKDLVKADPEQVTDIGSHGFAEEVAEHPVQVTLLADHTGCDLVKKGAMDLGHRFPREFPIKALVEKGTAVDRGEDVQGGAAKGRKAATFDRPSPRGA